MESYSVVSTLIQLFFFSFTVLFSFISSDIQPLVVAFSIHLQSYLFPLLALYSNQASFPPFLFSSFAVKVYIMLTVYPSEEYVYIQPRRHYKDATQVNSLSWI